MPVVRLGRVRSYRVRRFRDGFHGRKKGKKKTAEAMGGTEREPVGTMKTGEDVGRLWRAVRAFQSLMPRAPSLAALKATVIIKALFPFGP